MRGVKKTYHEFSQFSGLKNNARAKIICRKLSNIKGTETALLLYWWPLIHHDWYLKSWEQEAQSAQMPWQKTHNFIQNWQLLAQLLVGSFLTLFKLQETRGQGECILEIAHQWGEGRKSQANEHISLTCQAPATGGNHSIRL